jgi:hypothetical protein
VYRRESQAGAAHDLRAAASAFFSGTLKQQLLRAQARYRRHLTVAETLTLLRACIASAEHKGHTSDCAAAQYFKAQLEDVYDHAPGLRADGAVLSSWRERVQVQTVTSWQFSKYAHFVVLHLCKQVATAHVGRCAAFVYS